jgi:hypothetical protein
LKKDTETLTNNNDIEQHVLQYFSDIFTSSHQLVMNELQDTYIPKLATTVDNATLTTFPLQDEIKCAVFDLNGDSAPGPDGYPGHFYQAF